jgi:hypothetical protein
MRSPLLGVAADLLPLLAVEESHFVATGGRVGRVLVCSGVNLGLASAEAADQAAARFADALAYLPAGARLQLVASNRPLRAADWVPRHLAQYRPPQGLEGYVQSLGDAYTAALAGRAAPDLRFHAVLSLPGAPGPNGRLARRFRRRRLLGRDRARHAEAVAELDRAATALDHALRALGIHAAPLGRQATVDLLWQCTNPDWSRDAAAPRAEALAQGRRSDGGAQGERTTQPVDLRTLRDRLAQSRLTRRADYLRLDWGYEATIALRALPEATFPGWLQALMATGVRFRLALHLAPLDKPRERTALGRTLRQRHGILRERQDKGLPPDIEQEQAYAEARELLEQMAAGDLRTFSTAVFVNVRAESPQSLQAALGQVVRALGDAGGTSVDRCALWQLPAWQATLPLAENPAGLAFRTVTTNLADTLPFLHHRAGTRGGPLVGFADPGGEAATLDLYDPALPNGNLLCVGASGSGKTLFAQSYALKHVAMGGRCIVLDRSLRHWDGLVAAIPGAATHVVGLASGFRVDPWQLPPGASGPSQAKLEYLLDLHALILGERHDGVVGLTSVERALLEAACRAVYREYAHPTEGDLHTWLTQEAAASTDDRRANLCAALAERLAPYIGEGTYAGLLDGPTTVAADAPLAVFNLKALPDRLVPLAMLPLLEHIWTQLADPARPTLVVLDEGWALLNHPASAPFVAEVTRTGRHHGLATLNLSQLLSDYTGPAGEAVLENASVALLLAQHPTALDAIQATFGLSDDERAAVGRLRTVKGQSAGAYLHAREGADAGVVQLTVTPEEYWLCTSHKPERELRELAIAAHDGDAWAAVRMLTRMTPTEREAFRARTTAPVDAPASGRPSAHTAGANGKRPRRLAPAD